VTSVVVVVVVVVVVDLACVVGVAVDVVVLGTHLDARVAMSPATSASSTSRIKRYADMTMLQRTFVYVQSVVTSSRVSNSKNHERQS